MFPRDYSLPQGSSGLGHFSSQEPPASGRTARHKRLFPGSIGNDRLGSLRLASEPPARRARMTTPTRQDAYLDLSHKIVPHLGPNRYTPHSAYRPTTTVVTESVAPSMPAPKRQRSRRCDPPEMINFKIQPARLQHSPGNVDVKYPARQRQEQRQDPPEVIEFVMESRSQKTSAPNYSPEIIDLTESDSPIDPLKVLADASDFVELIKTEGPMALTGSFVVPTHTFSDDAISTLTSPSTDRHLAKINTNTEEVVKAKPAATTKVAAQPSASTRSAVMSETKASEAQASETEAVSAPIPERFKSAFPVATRPFGIELETLPDWPGIGKVMIKPRNGIHLMAADKFFNDTDHAYDLIAARSMDESGRIGSINITVDSNRSKDFHDCPLRNGLEIASDPYDLVKNKGTDPKVLIKIFSHLEQWVYGEVTAKFEPGRLVRSARASFNVNLSDWIKQYESDRQSGRLNQGLPTSLTMPRLEYVKAEVGIAMDTKSESDANFKCGDWVLSLDQTDINHMLEIRDNKLLQNDESAPNNLSRFYLQANVSMLPEELSTSLYRDHICPATTDFPFADLEKEKGSNGEFHYQKPYPKFLEMEQNILETGQSLADRFVATLSGKQALSDQAKAFVVQLAYVMGLHNLHDDRFIDLYSLDSDNQPTIPSSFVKQVSVLGKDRYVRGLLKTSLHDFFHKVLTKDDRETLVGSRTKLSNITHFVEKALLASHYQLAEINQFKKDDIDKDIQQDAKKVVACLVNPEASSLDILKVDAVRSVIDKVISPQEMRLASEKEKGPGVVVEFRQVDTQESHIDDIAKATQSMLDSLRYIST